MFTDLPRIQHPSIPPVRGEHAKQPVLPHADVRPHEVLVALDQTVEHAPGHARTTEQRVRVQRLREEGRVFGCL